MVCSSSGLIARSIAGTRRNRITRSVSLCFEPKHLAGCLITGRLYCTARAMWKLSWFLRDFGYDTELLGNNEIDDSALVGLQGVLKVSHAIAHGISVLNLDGFAPLSRWQELSPTAATGDDPPGSEVA